MTYLKRAMIERPYLDPKALVLYHCPAEYGLMQAWPPEACPSGGAPCIECWNREVPDDA